MKHNLLFAALFISGAVTAQQESQILQFRQKALDSLMKDAQRKNQPFIMPAPKNNSTPNDIMPYNTFPVTPKTFEAVNPGATVINRTARGTIYSMPTDNMAMLLPDMSKTEKMPGSSPSFKLAPRSNMPNPLYPQMYRKKNNIK